MYAKPLFCYPTNLCLTLMWSSFFRIGLAVIGLNTSITDFKKAGLKPMFYGITIHTLVTLTALVVIWCMGLM